MACNLTNRELPNEGRKMSDIWKDIEAQVDWDCIEKCMRLFDWKWHFDGEERVPTIDEMKQTCKELLYDVNKSLNGEMDFRYNGKCAGGFEVEFVEDIDSIDWRISFSLQEIYVSACEETPK